MLKKEIEHILSGYYKKLQLNEDKLTGKPDPDAIHDFRVTYKKLRALRRLVSSAEGRGGKIGTGKKLKRLYCICGQIRDLQLQQDRVRKMAGKDKKHAEEYLATLEDSVKELKPELRRIIDGKPVSVSRKKAKGKLPDELKPEDFFRFVRLKWNEIELVTHKRLIRDTDLHTVRKCLKDIYYDLRLYRKNGHAQLSKKMLNDSYGKNVSALLEQLGNFQDLSVFLSGMERYWLNSFDLTTHQFLAGMQAALQKEQQELRRSLKKNIGHLRPGKLYNTE